MDSGCSQRRNHLTRESGNTSQSIRRAHKSVQAAFLGQYLPTLYLFKDPALSQVFKYGLGVEKIKTVKSSKHELNDDRRRVSAQITYFQEYINRLAVNATVSVLFKVKFACSISRHFKIREKFWHSNSGMLQFESGEHSRHLRVEGAYCQILEIQMSQAFKMKIICSFKD